MRGISIKDENSIPLVILVTVVILLGVLWVLIQLDVDIDMGQVVPFMRGEVVPDYAKEGLADAEGVTLEGMRSVEKASSKFAFDVYEELAKEEGNIVFSPYGVSTVLSMTYEGSKGDTKEEIGEAINIPREDDVRRPAMGAVYNKINREDAGYDIETLNSVWIRENYEPFSDFIDVIERFYVGQVNSVDLEDDPENTRASMNEKVKDITGDIIEELFPRGSVADKTTMMLANAVHFDGNWEIEFNKEHTEKEDFHITEEETLEVAMMQGEGEYGYYENEEAQILELSYEDKNASMLVILPKEGNLASLENELDFEKMNEWKEGIEEEKVRVYLPRFKIGMRHKMSDHLKNLGVLLAFDREEADFSNIFEQEEENLFLDEIIHGAFISVNEKEAEILEETEEEETEEEKEEDMMVFRADNPFIFTVIEKEGGNIILMGRVQNPLE